MSRDDDCGEEPLYDDLGDDCHHEHADCDILSGIAICPCGHRWTMTREEIQREIEHIAAYQEPQDIENRWGWCRDLWSRFRAVFARRQPPVATSDDDIPF